MSCICRQVLCWGALVISSSCGKPLAHSQAAPRPHQARWTISLKNYGWVPPRFESDRSFFRDFTIAKLMAVDDNTRLLFNSNDALAAYETVQQGDDWRTAKRTLRAFFLQADSGSLGNTREWQTCVRKDEGSGDSESRMIALDSGRFLVDACGTLTVYATDLSVVRQYKLERDSPIDIWAVQSVDEGKQIFLRHELLGVLSVGYEWRDTDTFSLLNSQHGDVYQGRGVRGADDGTFIAGGPYRTRVFVPGAPPRDLCTDPRCGDVSAEVVMGTRYLVIRSYWDGIGVVDRDRDLLWFNSPSRGGQQHDMSFGHVVTSSGRRFAVSVAGCSKKAVFDSVRVRSNMIFVYDVTDSKYLFAQPFEELSDFALSPDGKRLAVLNGDKISLFDINLD